MPYELIKRLHIDSGNPYNNWSDLGRYLNRKITPISRHKAIIKVRNVMTKIKLRNKIIMYNRKKHTDFHME